MTSTPTRKVIIFSGGSAANSLVDVFNEVLERNYCSLSYVIPISDNGGSSSELIRVFGGPGIGDVRSRFFVLQRPWNIFFFTGSSLFRPKPTVLVIGLSLFQLTFSKWK